MLEEAWFPQSAFREAVLVRAGALLMMGCSLRGEEAITRSFNVIRPDRLPLLISAADESVSFRPALQPDTRTPHSSHCVSAAGPHRRRDRASLPRAVGLSRPQRRRCHGDAPVAAARVCPNALLTSWLFSTQILQQSCADVFTIEPSSVCVNGEGAALTSSVAPPWRLAAG